MISIISETPDKITADFINEWRPSDRQRDFFEVNDDIYEALYGGALGGGKSEVILMLPIIRQFYLHPLFHGIIFRRTYEQLEKSLIQRALDHKHYGPLMTAGYCKYDATHHTFKFKNPNSGDYNGAKIRFGYMELDQHARDHKTNEYHYVGIDEASEFSEYQLTYISTRLRTSTKELPVLYRLASNPGGPSHAYLRDRFVKPAPAGNVILRDKVTQQLRIFIPAKLQDNPHLAENDPNYINRLQLLAATNPDEFKALSEGDWFTFEGQVFREFRDVQRIGEPENALHVCDSFSIPSWWPKILSIDWGFDANTVAHLGAISPDDRVFIYKEYVRKNVPVATWASEIAQMCQGEENIKRVYLDGSAWNDIGNNKTIADQFRVYSNFTPIKALGRGPGERVAGKILVHDYLRWTKKPARYVPPEGYDVSVAEKILRIHGLKAYEEYRALFTPEKEEKNLPKLQIFRHCENLIETIKLCQYAEKKKDGKSTEDVKEFPGDDAYDNLRYLLAGTGSYFREAKEENDKRRKQGEAVEELKKTGNYNVYMHRVSELERNERSQGVVLRRGRNRAYRFH